jgi:hypothetical protein
LVTMLLSTVSFPRVACNLLWILSIESPLAVKKSVPDPCSAVLMTNYLGSMSTFFKIL